MKTIKTIHCSILPRNYWILAKIGLSFLMKLILVLKGSDRVNTSLDCFCRRKTEIITHIIEWGYVSYFEAFGKLVCNFLLVFENKLFLMICLHFFSQTVVKIRLTYFFKNCSRYNCLFYSSNWIVKLITNPLQFGVLYFSKVLQIALFKYVSLTKD